MKKTYYIVLFIGIFIFVVVFLIKEGQYLESKRIQYLKQEIPTLQLIKEAVLEKYVPDSIKNASRDASHNLMYVDEDSNDYYAAKEQIWTVDDYIQKSKPCRYIDSLLRMKEKELKELQN